MKVGFSLAFPLFRHWDTGGEVLYGFNQLSDQKYEIAGYLDYFFKHNFSFGVGYRVHLFQTNSPDDAPLGPLPYREGYGEGYSVLKVSLLSV